jgi:hypothetical protein
MNLFGLNRRRSENLLLLVGQLVLIAYVFQVAALDHWNLDPSRDVIGVAGSSAHAAVHAEHCHGGPSSCAEAGGGFAQFSADQPIRLPQDAPTLALAADANTPAPDDIQVSILLEPPRATV